jgi:DNA polymerase-3 subunit gamma/tau
MLEMALIKAAAAERVVPVTEILERLEGIHVGDRQKPGRELQPKPVSKPQEKEKAPTFPPPPPKAEKTGVAKEKPVTEETKPVAEKPVERPLEEKKPAPQEAPKVTGSDKVDVVAQPQTKDVRKHWDEFIDYVMERKRWMANTLRICSGVREEDHNLVLKFDDPSEYKVLKTPENIKFLTEFSQDFFQKEFKIVMRVRGGDSEDVNGQEGNGPQEERRALAKDPLIQMATEVLGGRVVKIRTGPRSR